MNQDREQNMDLVDRIIDRNQARQSALIQILLDIQEEFNWLSRSALDRVSERLGVPFTLVQHIVTFYKAFSVVPKGRHRVHVCVGTACHVRGAARVLDRVEEIAGISSGETDLDLKFSLETVNCLGCCALGPVVDVNGKVHGNMAPENTKDLLSSYE